MTQIRRTIRTLSLVLTPMVLLATLLMGNAPARVTASSHREAPMISADPYADNTDTYAFNSPDGTDTVTLIANWIPFEFPEGGPNWYRFDDNVLYEIHIDNVGDAKSHISYQFQFKTTIRNGETFLYNTGTINNINDTDWNQPQTYTLTKVTRVNGADPVSVVLGRNLPVPPVNIGPKSTPNYPRLARQAIRMVPAGAPVATQTKVFAGQRDDPFFVDLGSIFDLLTLRPQQPPVGYEQGIKTGIDNLKGYNVHTIALQVPTRELLAAGANPDPVIGVWATSSRRTTRVLNGVGGVLSGKGIETHSGEFVQVSRLGMPLTNEVVIPLALKDAFNNLKPEQDFDVFQGKVNEDVGALLRKSVLNPELQRLLKALYNVPNPTADPPNEDRSDILDIFLRGMVTTRPFTIETADGPMTLDPGFNVNRPRGVGPDGVRPAEMLRLNTSIKGDLCRPNPNYELGLLGGDACGFPNGRRLWDDVTDIELLAVAGAAYNVLTTGPTFNFNTDLIGVLRDGVNGNDIRTLGGFPFVATPHQGADHNHEGTFHIQLPIVFDRDLPPPLRRGEQEN